MYVYICLTALRRRDAGGRSARSRRRSPLRASLSSHHRRLLFLGRRRGGLAGRHVRELEHFARRLAHPPLVERGARARARLPPPPLAPEALRVRCAPLLLQQQLPRGLLRPERPRGLGGAAARVRSRASISNPFEASVWRSADRFPSSRSFASADRLLLHLSATATPTPARRRSSPGCLHARLRLYRSNLIHVSTCVGSASNTTHTHHHR